MKKFLYYLVFIFVIWVMLTGIGKEELVTGALVSVIVSLLFVKGIDFWKGSKNPFSLILGFIKYLLVFIPELIKANIDVAKRVINPKLPINPGIVAIKTELKSDEAKMMLANSITLTPGTLTMDVRDDHLLIHWIDVKDTEIEGATKEIAQKFENQIKEMFE